MKKNELAKVKNILITGGVGVLPTDTIYGIVGSALSARTVLRIYRLRRRNLKKPMIILIGAIEDLKAFGVRPNVKTLRVLEKVWPGKVSVILKIPNSPIPNSNLHYLHRGTGTLAFRMPRPVWLRKLLVQTGPLVAPSANFEGEPPAKTIREARKYFGNAADFYHNNGEMGSRPSTLIKVEKGRVTILREGAVKVGML